MEKKISNVLSIILHPLLVPVFFVLITFQFPICFLPLQFISMKYIMLLYVFLMTGLVPAGLVLILKRLKLVKSLKMEQRNDRVFPILIMAVFYYVAYYTLNRQGSYPVLNLFLVGSAILALFTLLINNYAKISLHMIAWGGFSGALTGLAFLFHMHPFLWIALVLFLSGVTGYVRLRSDAHRPWEVYLGYLLGFAVMFSLFLIV